MMLRDSVKLAIFCMQWMVFVSYGALPGVAVEPRIEGSSANVVVPLAGEPRRHPYAETLVKEGEARHTLATLADPRCVARVGFVEPCRSGVRSTVDEALFLRHIFERDGIQRATIVTSGAHWLRARAVFGLVFLGSEITLEITTVPEARPRQPFWSREIVKLVPSIGAAIVGRLWPGLYRWINWHRAADWDLKGYPYG